MLIEEFETLVPAECRVRIGDTRIFAIGAGLEFGVDAIVVEQDTARVLDPSGLLTEPTESFPELVAGMVGESLPRPGSVLVEAGYPLKLHAIVHDLERYPTWRVEWVLAALAGIREELAARSCSSVVMPMLAVRHGTFEAEAFVGLLGDWIGAMQGLERVYLVMPEDVSCSVLDCLQGRA